MEVQQWLGDATQPSVPATPTLVTSVQQAPMRSGSADDLGRRARGTRNLTALLVMQAQALFGIAARSVVVPTEDDAMPARFRAGGSAVRIRALKITSA